MEILIIKFIIIYLVIATFILFNLLCNPNITWKYINKETGEIREVPSWLTIYFCFYWIITIPILLLQRGKNNE